MIYQYTGILLTIVVNIHKYLTLLCLYILLLYQLRTNIYIYIYLYIYIYIYIHVCVFIHIVHCKGVNLIPIYKFKKNNCDNKSLCTVILLL